jgi:hypothetical protein
MLRRIVGQVGNLRPIVNRPAEGKRLVVLINQADRLVAAMLLSGQPILAAAGFPARWLALYVSGRAGWKAGCGQECLPHYDESYKTEWHWA